jgi:Asp-tRNA(Asn)/Glu-tRNA(Gln) amidotransferase A subunit family amidase
MHVAGDAPAAGIPVGIKDASPVAGHHLRLASTANMLKEERSS